MIANTVATHFIGGIPGDPAAVRACAHALEEASQGTASSLASLVEAGYSTPSWLGQAAQAFTEDIRADTGILDSITSKLRNGAMVLENYACILEEAKAQAATLRSDLASFITSTAGNPSAATAIPAAKNIHIDDLGRLKATISTGHETKVLYSDEPRFFSNVGFVHLHDIRIRPIRIGTTGGGNQAVLIVE